MTTKASNENLCDVCLGLPLESGRKCMCGGSGKKSDAVDFLRDELFRSEREVANLKLEVNRLTYFPRRTVVYKEKVAEFTIVGRGNAEQFAALLRYSGYGIDAAFAVYGGIIKIIREPDSSREVHEGS